MHRASLGCCLLILAGCQALRPDPQAQIDRLAGTSWRVESISGVAVSPDIESTLEFDAQARVVGRGGCNPYVSDIGMESGLLRFAGVLAAEFGCTEEQTGQEERFFGALAATRQTRIEKDVLILLDESGQPLARLKRLTLLIKDP